MNTNAIIETQHTIPKSKAIIDVQRQIGSAITLLEFLQTNADAFSQFETVWTYTSGGPQLELYKATREQFRELMRHFPGKWDKAPYYDGTTLVYSRTISGVEVRVSKVPPPPRCEIVEVKVRVPGQYVKAHTTVTKQLRCK